MQILRAPGLARRVASAVFRRAATRFERWLDGGRRAVPAASELEARSGPATALDRRHGVVAITWDDGARAHVDRWLARLVAADGPLDARGVRRLRSAVRRLRTIVAAVTRPEDAAAGQALDRALRRLVKRLSDVRDLDVALDHLATRASTCGSELERAALDELASSLAARRERALARARRRLRTEAIAQVVTEVRVCVATACVVSDGPSLAERWWTTVAARVDDTLSAAGDDDLEALHSLRIAARSMRHGLEFFADIAPGPATAWLACAVQMQRAIGRHRDAALFQARLANRRARASERGRVALARGLEPSVVAAVATRREAWEACRDVLAEARGLSGRPDQLRDR